MKFFRFSIFAALFLTGCIFRIPEGNKTEECPNLSVPDSLYIKAKTRIETGGEKVVLRQNIYIKNHLIRIDTLGLFDDVVNTIIIKNDRFYVIYYQQQVIYTFTNEESFYNTFSIYIPVLRLPFILTLSDSAIPDCKSSNDGLVKICGEDRIIISRDIKNCKSVKIDFISPLSGDISAIYSDFSEINGTNMFHRLKITGHKEKVFADITVLMVKREEISEKIFEPENFKDFKNVRK